MATINTTSGDYDYTYLSLGAGVQSSALLVLACTTDAVPTPDVAIFADTGDEPYWVYDYFKLLVEFGAEHGVEVISTQNPLGKLSDAAINGRASGEQRFVSLPTYVPTDQGRGVPLRRMCTKDFKIDPIQRKVRELLGYRPRQRIKENVRAMLGISLDEIQRMKPSQERWVTNTWPLVDLGLRRSDCLKIVSNAGLPEPKRSACYYCPFHSDEYWKELKTHHPDVFQQAVDFEQRLSEAVALEQASSDKPLQGSLYLHRSCKPLDEVEFKATDPDQVDMFGNECEGMCGV
jgi:hypothetical protein